MPYGFTLGYGSNLHMSVSQFLSHPGSLEPILMDE